MRAALRSLAALLALAGIAWAVFAYPNPGAFPMAPLIAARVFAVGVAFAVAWVGCGGIPE